MDDLLPVLTAGLALGFLASVPIAGPISILVFALGIENRLRSAFGVALGGALAEALYAFLAFWGFSHYLARYPIVAGFSRGITAVILLMIGIRMVYKKQPQTGPKAPPKAQKGARRGLLIGLTISLLNPTLILTWTVASGMVVASNLLPVNPHSALPFSVGVCLGIFGWFALLLHLVVRYRARFHPDSLGRLLIRMGWLVILVAAVFGGMFFADILACARGPDTFRREPGSTLAVRTVPLPARVPGFRTRQAAVACREDPRILAAEPPGMAASEPEGLPGTHVYTSGGRRFSRNPPKPPAGARAASAPNGNPVSLHQLRAGSGGVADGRRG